MRGSDLNILLVEDNAGDARLITEMLKETEFTTATCYNATTLLEAIAPPFEPSTVATVLLDLNLPDSKGISTLQKIAPSYTASAIIVLTGSDDERLAMQALRQGAQNYLTKDTFGPKELSQTLRYAIERHGFVMRLRESDNELIARERRFRSLIEYSSELTLLVNSDARITYASPAVHRLYGFTAQGLSLFDALQPRDGVILSEVFAQALERAEAALPVTLTTRTAEGDIRVLEGTVTNLLHSMGVQAIVLNLHDITQRVVAMERVAFERNNQKALINSTTDMIWSVDRELRLITANKSFSHSLKDLGDHEIEPGQTIVPEIRLGTYDSSTWKGYYERALQGESFTVEEHATEPGLVWGEFTFNPIREGPHVVGVACSCRDITRRKRAEEDLRLLNSQLEERVVERTRELLEVNDELSGQMRQNTRLSELLMMRNNDLMAGIAYARRIQEGIFHPLEDLGFFSATASLALPRDVVSGDFLWHHETTEHLFVVIGDCTGHGVPGALMSMLGHSLLTQLIMDRRNTRPEMILTRLDQALDRLFTQHSADIRVNDGMDIGCLVLEKSTMQLTFCGALMKAIIVREGMLHILDCTRAPIGGLKPKVEKKFTGQRFAMRPGDRIVLSTDGFYSQFGGLYKKKMKPAHYRDLIRATAELGATEAIRKFEADYRAWMGAEPQVDDVLVALLDI